MKRLSFASDNTSGVHPRVLEEIQKAAQENFTPAYGVDVWTERFGQVIRKTFSPQAQAFLVFNGSAANVLSLAGLLRPYEAVLAGTTSHLESDECGAFERFTGSKILQVPTENGKLCPEALEPYVARRGNPHTSQPRVLTVTQTTECGTVYTLDELRALAAFCRKQNWLFHVDGARFSNAAVALGVELKDLTETGIDVLSFGGTKNGLMLGEAIIVLAPERVSVESYAYIRKQGLQLASKMRFMAAQFIPYLEENLWKENAQQANAMMQRLVEGIRTIPELKLMHPPQANAAFVRFPKSWKQQLEEEFYFYMWDEEDHVARWMTSFETKPDQVDAFLKALRMCAQSL